MKYAIKNRFTGAVIFEAEIECEASVSEVIKLGLSVRAAVKARANLVDANLAGANLAGANLADANLARANLVDANLADANLARANLVDANLADANLADANLARANLADANLARANLADANLVDANLADANLVDAKWRGVVIKNTPIQIFNLPYRVTILDAHMQIGCELHTLEEWSEFDDRRIAQMEGIKAIRFWRQHKDVLLALAKSAGRGVEVAHASDCTQHNGPALDDLLEALKLMLLHSCVADSAAEDKFPEDHAAESAARAAIDRAEGNAE